MQVVLLCLAPRLFSLSAFLCPVFHFGDCPQKARLVNSTIARALVEENKTVTAACSLSQKGSQYL